MEHAIQLSYGQAFVATDKRHHRSSMAVQVPVDDTLVSQGACALIADSTSKNAIARQAGDLSIRGFLADYYSTPEHWDVKTAATRVLRALNGWCFSQSRFVKGGGYVSSLSALVLKERQAHLFHAGDTLVFRLRGAEFEQISRDHVTDIGGYLYPSRALGMDASVDIDYLTLPLKQGDIFLFTTQAVRGTLLPSDYVSEIRRHAHSLDEACRYLAKAAAERASERGYDGHSFCFQMVRVDQLPEERVEAPNLHYGKLPIPPELNDGDRFEGFEVLEGLSPRGKARVYRVRDIDSGQHLIMKTPSPELALKDTYLKHFMLQQWVAERINSPFIVKSVAQKRPRRYLYYLMENVEGERLSTWLERHPNATLAQRLDIAQQLCKAVHALNRKNVLHQRICPSNIMLDQHDQVILIDFGTCHFLEQDSQETARELVREVGLTPHSAPEYALDGNISRRSDQYSLASVIYWMIAGHLPYGERVLSVKRETDLEAMVYTPLSTSGSVLPPVLDETLERALMPKKPLRFRRLSELVYGLKLTRQAMHGPVEEDSLDVDPASLGDPARRWKWLTGLLIIALIASFWL
ncbi:bifunctional protein-serine/threonine kinase/phosphatase [Larsenimonas salina]|uniref:bifunctional protein-serine/threonine kinase/phosphatase n=1 Tax=Larsenimonas salina TaxID=1295565 RepID=UPI002073EF6E|nr:bifunctional protein-serine/threonine kinase/phosphatase [Larsenimonas salina]MCM5703348.1 bifunctional serine/threonine-protein phosphatase/kinase [Larsenimonas salina]